MLSLTPFFFNTYVPTLASCHLQSDSDLARNVYYRQPNYSYHEDDKQANLEVELPGVAKENVKLDLHGNKLAIAANRFSVAQKAVEKLQPDNCEKDTDTKEKKENEQHMPSVVYELNLRIGQKYDLDNIQASMDGHGLLKMLIPIKKEQGPRPIEIRSATL